jgi:hypothetical protein
MWFRSGPTLPPAPSSSAYCAPDAATLQRLTARYGPAIELRQAARFVGGLRSTWPLQAPTCRAALMPVAQPHPLGLRRQPPQAECERLEIMDGGLRDVIA